MNRRIMQADFDNPVHRSGIVDVLNSYACDPVGGGRPLSDGVRGTLVDGLRRQPNVLVLLAFDAEQPVGIAVCFFGYSTFQARRLLNVHDLAVVPDYRGQGIGRALLTEAERLARGTDCCKLTLEVQEDNFAARGLYERFGFIDFVIGASAPTRFLAKPLD